MCRPHRPPSAALSARLPPPQLSPGSEDDEGHEGISRENLGRIQFSVGYNFQESTLTVKIMKAQELPAKDFSGTSDPFVKIYLLPDKKHKLETKVKRKNLNPHWNETFLFEGRGWDRLGWAAGGAQWSWGLLSSLLGWISSAQAGNVVAISDEMGWPSRHSHLGGVSSVSRRGDAGGGSWSPAGGCTRELTHYQPPWWPEATRGASAPHPLPAANISPSAQARQGGSSTSARPPQLLIPSVSGTGFPYEKVVQRVLYLQVLDYDRFSRNDPIGEVSIPLNKVDLTQMQTFWKDLKPCTDGSVRLWSPSHALGTVLEGRLPPVGPSPSCYPSRGVFCVVGRFSAHWGVSSPQSL